MNDNLAIAITDPAWDYYVAWTTINEAKTSINSALIKMSHQESQTLDVDEQIKENARDAIAKLQEIADGKF